AASKLLLSTQENPGYPHSYRVLAACYVHMGLLDEAREIIARLRAITPNLVPGAAQLRRPADRELFLSGLRVAAGEAGRAPWRPIAALSGGQLSRHMSSGDPDLLARIVTERPRLMATARAIAQARTAIQQNAVAQRWQREVTKQADLLLALPALTQSWTHVPE